MAPIDPRDFGKLDYENSQFILQGLHEGRGTEKGIM